MTPSHVTLAGGRGWLNAAAAASIARVDAAIGHLLQITEAGRTEAEQQAHWKRYLAYLNGGPWAPLAAKPRTSPHEFGNAIDTNERLVALLAEHGWSRPLKSEPWHFVYNPNNDQHRYDPAPAGEEDDMFSPEDRALLTELSDRMGDSVFPNFNAIKAQLDRVEATLGNVDNRMGDSVLPNLDELKVQLGRINALIEQQDA